MKQLYYITLLILSLLCFQLSSFAQKTAKSFSNKNTIRDYIEKKVTSFSYPISDTSSIVYFKDSINKIKVQLYLNSNIANEFSKISKKNSAILNIKTKLKKCDAVLIVNDSIIKINNIEDSKLLLPTFLDHFFFNDSEYLLLKLNLISYMSGDLWYNIFIKFNNNIIVSQLRTSSNGKLTKKKILNRLLRINRE